MGAKTLTTVAILLLAAACKPASDQPAQSAAPASAPADAPAIEPAFAGDFTVVGTEPFWALDVTASQLSFHRPEGAPATAANPGPTVAGGAATWNAGPLVLTLTQADCSDGMSDLTYPYTATVVVDGQTLNGCAKRPAAP